MRKDNIENKFLSIANYVKRRFYVELSEAKSMWLKNKC